MLHAELVITADDGALEKRPDALNSLSVDVPTYPFLVAVVDGLVATLTSTLRQVDNVP